MKSSPYWLYITFVYFLSFLGASIWGAGGCWYSLRVSQCVTCVFCMALESALCFSTAAKRSGRTVTDIIQNIKWCEWKTMQEMTWCRKITCWMFQLFSGVKEKVLGTGSNERPAAYYIAFNCLFVLHFYCQLDLQWKNYTMLVFCFIMLLFLIFQNIRNFILLYVMAEKYFLPWSIRNLQIWWAFPTVKTSTTTQWQNNPTLLEYGSMQDNVPKY